MYSGHSTQYSPLPQRYREHREKYVHGEKILVWLYALRIVFLPEILHKHCINRYVYTVKIDDPFVMVFYSVKYRIINPV